jgi:C1A family cysteine protease
MPTRAPSQTAFPAQQTRWYHLPVLIPAAALVCFAVLLTGCSSSQSSQISFSNASDWRAELVVAQPATGGALDLPALVDSLQEQRLSPALTTEGDASGSQAQVLELAGSGGPDQVRRLIYGELNRVLTPLQADTAITLAGAVHAGQGLTFSFESNPSTGYAWQPASYDPSLLQPMGEAAYASRGVSIGAPAKQSMQFTALRDGAASIRWVYRRGWDAAAADSSRSLAVRAPELAAISDLSSPLAVASPVSLTDLQNVAIPQLQPQAETSLPASFDWRQSTTLPAIRDQGSCGSCWAFATVGVLEAAISIHNGFAPDLSEQYLVSCNVANWGCAGGFTAHDYHQDTVGKLQSSPGAVLESSLPYTGKDLACGGPYEHPYRIQSWHYISGGTASEDAIKQAIFKYGPVETMVCKGDGWDRYTGGVYTHNDTTACGGLVNHAVDLVGWNDAMKGADGQAYKVWILRNSWGVGWGDQGYMYIKRGISSIGYAASYVTYDGSGMSGQANACSATKVLACGSQTPGRNDQAGSTSLTSSYACSSRRESGPEVTYEFVPTWDGPVTARLSGLTADLDLFAQDATTSGCTSKTCLGFGDNQVTFNAKAGQPVYLTVDGNNGAVGDYNLSVQCVTGYLPIVSR